ncbi:hypothetical protein [Nocardia sp. AG03]|uniref:TPR repeat region-containing protein n=1 Tax=Nocardia sp. AG03 TaxID=3025312 RepID=UPI0024185BCB|nr:hypothetical protein [Nocardia sp. AG03]
MTTPTIPQVESWKPQTLIAAGQAIIKAGTDLTDRMAEVDLAVDKSAVNWQGDASAAASMRAVSELLTASQSKRATATIGDAMVAQGGTIDGYRSAVLNTRDAAVNVHGMTVAPDGTVTAPTVPGDDTDATRSILQGQLDRQAADFQTSLKENLAHLGTSLTALRFTAALGLTDLDQHGGPGGATVGAPTLSGAGGKALGTQIQEAVDKGEPIPTEVLDQLTEDLKATGIPPSQLQAYLNGEPTTIPAGTQQYLKELYSAAGADGFTAASQQLQAQGPAGQQAASSLANGVLVISNEKVGTGRGSDGKLTGGGSYENLPQDMRDLISTRVAPNGMAPDANTTMYPGDSTIVGNHKEFVTDQKDFLQALSQAEPGNEPGTKMSTELIRQGMHTAWVEDHGGGLPFSDSPSDDPKHVEPLEQAIALGSRNTDGVHAILTGSENPDILGAGYNPDTAVLPLLQRDDGTAMGSLTDWISRDAHVTAAPDSPDYQGQKEAATQAGEAARGLAEIMSTEKSADGTNNYTTLLSGDGKIGDGTADQVAEALAPYVGNMVGMPSGHPGDITDTMGFGPDFGGKDNDTGGPIGPLRVFSILDSDEGASTIINGTALAESQRMDRLFALEEANGDGNPNNAKYSSRLQWLVNQGLDVQSAQETQNGVDASASEASRNAKWNTAWTASQIVAGGMGPGGIGVAAGSEFLKPFVLSADSPSTPEQSPLKLDTTKFDFDYNPGDKDATYRPTSWGGSEHREYTMLRTLAEAGKIDMNQVPDIYKNENGEFKPYSQYRQDYTNGSTVEQDSAEVGPNGRKGLLQQAGINPDSLQDYTAQASPGGSEYQALNSTIQGGDKMPRQEWLEWLAGERSANSGKNTW